MLSSVTVQRDEGNLRLQEEGKVSWTKSKRLNEMFICIWGLGVCGEIGSQSTATFHSGETSCEIIRLVKKSALDRNMGLGEFRTAYQAQRVFVVDMSRSQKEKKKEKKDSKTSRMSVCLIF